jgi:hypothetical protein
MARVVVNSALPNYFVSIDVRNDVDRASIPERYEAGEILLLEHAGLQFDRAFLADVRFPNRPGLKKLKSRYLVAARDRGERPNEDVLSLGFGGDSGRYNYFVEQVAALNSQLDALCRQLFPAYRMIKPSITWRMSETVNEAMHIDAYREDYPDHHLRMFVNLATTPRIWHVSYSLEYLLQHHLADLTLEFVRTATPGRICHDLNVKVFGDRRTAGCDGHPRHVAIFDPGDVWIVDSRKIAHQIVYGQSALSTDHAVEVASMRDPNSHYFAVVERYRQTLA